MWSLFVALPKAASMCRVGQLCKGLVAAALGFALYVPVAIAAGPAPPADNAGSQPSGTTTWGGLGWGIGIAADFNLSGKRVTDAEIVGPAPGLLRVKDTSSDVAVGFVLEAHYFFRDWAIPVAPGGCSAAAVSAKSAAPGVKFALPCTDAAIGPFVAIEVANGTSSSPQAGGLITAFALGAMVGFRHGSVDQNGLFNPDTKNPNSSWNFGIGLRINPHAQVLGDGFAPNMPPPAGETAVRWKYEPRYGIMLLSSFSF
jgi:hypothetical protein